MQFENFRPILSGIAGSLVAMALYRHWSKSMPKGAGGKTAEHLRAQYRVAIWLSNTMSAVGIFSALALYKWGGYAKNDWRPIALGFGFAFSAPLFVLPLVAKIIGGASSEAYIAYALSQKTPPIYLYPLLAIGVPILVLAIINW